MMQPLDITACDDEPIHTPGAIQPHGFLVALDARTRAITHVSANVRDHLGREPHTLLGEPWNCLLAPEDDPELADLTLVAEGRPSYQSTFRLAGSDGAWDAIAHRRLDHLLVEFEPARSAAGVRIAELYRDLQNGLVRLEQSTSLKTMGALAVTRVRQLCGFDRVMLYRFDAEWNGEVIAEDRREDLETFLGLHYPASDIPRQARELYAKNWLRFITNRDYEPSPLVAASGVDAAALDLSYSVLRSVSPIHLEYLRNMGVCASMSISILRQGRLWGLIACHHYAPKFVPYDLRKASELLGHFMSLQLTQVEAQEAEAERTRLAQAGQALIANLEREEDVANALVTGKPNLIDFVAAGGAAVVDSARITRVGQTPNEAEIARLAARIAEDGREVYAVESLGAVVGGALLDAVAAGVLAVNLGHARPYQVLWFRPERIRTVDWAGDPRKQPVEQDQPHRLTPRGSFALWRETVKGRSEPWTADELAAAAQLRQDIVRLMLRRAETLAVANDDLRLANLEREKALDAERAARAESERLHRVKDEFVATLSHELRTPLNAILGWSQLLRMTADAGDAELAEGLEVIERNAKSQAAMIDDLLEISRIVSGRLRLDLQEVNISSIIEGAIDSISVAAEGKQLRLERMIDPLFGVHATGDPNRLRQIAWNLLSNAVKFTPKGGKVQVVLQRVDSHIEFTVADTGIGIRRDFLPHVFERYQQADPTVTRQFGGLGLGLSIVRNLVELHGGVISVDSPGEGKGATFTVSLPLRVLADDSRDSAASAPAHGADAAANVQLRGLNILVVDDEDDARDLVRRVLTAEGCRVSDAPSAAAALAQAQEQEFDLLVSDIGMPREDGYSLIRNWRRSEQQAGAPRTPAIALTAYARAGDRRAALMAGFNAHLAKPVDAGELITIIASLTNRIAAN